MKPTFIASLALCLGGCGSPDIDYASNNPEGNAIIETAIRRAAEKCTGELTETDLEKITILHLLEGGLTDIRALAKLNNIREFHLWGNKLIDLSPLVELKHLKTLDVRYNPSLTKAEVAKLQNALPDCEIHSNAEK